MFHEGECVRVGESFGTIVTFFRDSVLVLLFRTFRTSKDDNGLREVSVQELSKPYETL